MITLEKGKLYQVRHWEKGWIIAEYIGKIEAHIAVGRRSDGATRWHEPASHHWREVVGSSFGLLHKGMQVREVTLDTLREIGRLKAEIERLRLEQMDVIRQLKDLCS